MSLLAGIMDGMEVPPDVAAKNEEKKEREEAAAVTSPPKTTPLMAAPLMAAMPPGLMDMTPPPTKPILQPRNDIEERMKRIAEGDYSDIRSSFGAKTTPDGKIKAPINSYGGGGPEPGQKVRGGVQSLFATGTDLTKLAEVTPDEIPNELKAHVVGDATPLFPTGLPDIAPASETISKFLGAAREGAMAGNPQAEKQTLDRYYIREYCPYQLMDNRFCNELKEKHPTTALFELTKRLKWNAPDFQIGFEYGLPMERMYIFKVEVNGMSFMNSIGHWDQKKAKANVAAFALQKMGFLDEDVENPL